MERHLMGTSHGGIHPIKGTKQGYQHLPAEKRICCHCGLGDARHYCMENEKFIHAHCAPAFLQTDEGRIIINHGHTVRLDFSAD
jgi:hypothetical protein